jgi:hypothetical protein
MILKAFIQELLKENIIKMQLEDKNDIESDIQDFLAFCIEKLEIKKSPTIEIVTEIPAGSHGAYWPDKRTIKIVGQGRCLSDILRSFAHELVHHQQNEQERIKIINQDGVGGHIEDEANSVAGQLVKSYGIANPKIYKIY